MLLIKHRTHQNTRETQKLKNDCLQYGQEAGTADDFLVVGKFEEFEVYQGQTLLTPQVQRPNRSQFSESQNQDSVCQRRFHGISSKQVKIELQRGDMAPMLMRTSKQHLA